MQKSNEEVLTTLRDLIDKVSQMYKEADRNRFPEESLRPLLQSLTNLRHAFVNDQFDAQTALDGITVGAHC